MQQEQQQAFDENLYSRQVAVYGAETQAKLLKMQVFIYGLRGLGLEVAKNLILAGPKSVTLCDREKLTISDLGSHFYGNEKDVHSGKTREEASVSQLKELNPYVNVNTYNGELTPERLAEFDVVVLCDVWDKEFIFKINQAVREKGHGFIYCQNAGLFGSAFVDFTDKFVVADLDGEEPKQAIIAGITQEVEGLANTTEDKRHGFQDGDYVTFREVIGMQEVNGQVFQIKVKSPYMFSIGDTTQFTPYEREGIAIQVKMPKEFEFKSFKDSLLNPFAPNKQELDLMDWEKIGRPEQLHIAFVALCEFYTDKKQLPQQNEDDAEQVWKLAQEINKTTLKCDLDEQVVKNCSRFARTQITPTTSFWGGIVAQEIVKFTGKFTPIRQWLHSEFFESLPESGCERTLSGTKYDDYIAIFGNKVLSDLWNAKGFMVGAGALGCEYIKMFALMGVGSGAQGVMTVTDDDSIEISNLNRQFLFRKNNVGHNKATVACGVGQQMNPACKFVDKALRVGRDNEKVFNDEFWESLTIIVNAVDNVNARRYIDDQCCYYGKPLFESGTLGTKCNSQLIIPFKTQSYSESQDPPEETIPLCTLKNFPYQIEHTIQWARDYFQGLFADGSIECIKYLENPNDYLKRTMAELRQQPSVLRARLETVKKFIDVAKKPDLILLIALARHQFQDIFNNQIKQLLYCFPPDHKTNEGNLFWTNPKRPPIPIEFDINDDTHIMFIQSSVNIFAQIFGLEKCTDVNFIKEHAKNVIVEEYQPRKMQLKENDKDQKEEKGEDDEEEIAKLTQELAQLKITETKLKECPFEKDDPNNWHIEFLASLANLRARNYKIPEVSPFQVKLIAGKIIPALATTTAMIVGAVGLEIFKYIQNKEVSKMRNAFMNLALPLFLFSEPLPPGQHQDQEFSEALQGPTKSIPSNWTAWDRIEVNKQMTLEQFIKYFKDTYNMIVTSMTYGTWLVFSTYPKPDPKIYSMEVSEMIVYKTNTELPNYKKFLDLVVVGDVIEDGVEKSADAAPVKYQYKK